MLGDVGYIRDRAPLTHYDPLKEAIYCTWYLYDVGDQDLGPSFFATLLLVVTMCFMVIALRTVITHVTGVIGMCAFCWHSSSSLVYRGVETACLHAPSPKKTQRVVFRLIMRLGQAHFAPPCSCSPFFDAAAIVCRRDVIQS